MIRVELYGMARQNTGVSQIELHLDTPDLCLADVLEAASKQCPALAERCLVLSGSGRMMLQPSYIANLNGDQFVKDPATTVPAGSTLLILSADAGG